MVCLQDQFEEKMVKKKKDVDHFSQETVPSLTLHFASSDCINVITVEFRGVTIHSGHISV